MRDGPAARSNRAARPLPDPSALAAGGGYGPSITAAQWPMSSPVIPWEAGDGVCPRRAPALPGHLLTWPSCTRTGGILLTVSLQQLEQRDLVGGPKKVTVIGAGI